MCAQQKALMYPQAVPGDHMAVAKIIERTLTSNCSTLHSRPTGYHGGRVAIVQDGGYVICNSGWAYSWQAEAAFTSGVGCNVPIVPEGYAARVWGREWNGSYWLTAANYTRAGQENYE